MNIDPYCISTDTIKRNKTLALTKVKVSLDDMADKTGCPSWRRMEVIKSFLVGLLFKLWEMEESQIIRLRERVLNEQ